jgi:hypothetical protein
MQRIAHTFTDTPAFVAAASTLRFSTAGTRM